MRIVTLIAAIVLLLAPVSAVAQRKTQVSAEAKRVARKLALAYVETADAAMLNKLAFRTIAFAGMVPGFEVALDGKRFNAGNALMDSALTLLGNNDLNQDAAALRNTVYILMEVAEGRASRGKGK